MNASSCQGQCQPRTREEPVWNRKRNTPQPLTQRSQRAFLLPDGLTHSSPGVAGVHFQVCSGLWREKALVSAQRWRTTGCFPGLGVYTQNENSIVHLGITRNFSKEEWYCLSYLTWVRSKHTNFFLSLPLRERRWWAVLFLCIHSVRREVLQDWLQPRLFLDQWWKMIIIINIWMRCVARRILVPPLGMEAAPPAVEAWVLTTGPPGKSWWEVYQTQNY